MRWFALTSDLPAGARITSGSLRVMNTTGATVTVDVGIQDYTDRIQFLLLVHSLLLYLILQHTTSLLVHTPVAHVIVNAHNGTNYQVDEQVTISGAGLTGTNTAKVCRWDAANLKVWLKDQLDLG